VVESESTFGRAVELQDLYAETLLELPPDGGRHARRDDEAHRIVGIVRARWLGIDCRGHSTQAA